MSCLIKRTALVLCLAAASISIVFFPATGFCKIYRFVFLADSRSDTPTVPHPKAEDLINKPVLGCHQ